MPVAFFTEGNTPGRLDPRWKVLTKILGATIDNSGGGGGGGSAGEMLPQLPGPVSGWAAPSDTAKTWARWNETDGIIYIWNTTSQAWEPAA